MKEKGGLRGIDSDECFFRYVCREQVVVSSVIRCECSGRNCCGLLFLFFKPILVTIYENILLNLIIM